MKLSVSVITYNQAGFIRQALESVLAQRTSFDFEVVVGDDASTDGTREIVLEYAARFPDRVRAVLPERNMGRSGLLMLAETLKHVRGAYIARMDGDDYWTSPLKLQRQVDFLDGRPECSLCFHNVEHVYENGSPSHPRFAGGPAPFTGVRDILRSCYIPGPSPVFRRSVVDPLPSWFFDVSWADWALYVLAAEQGKLGYIDEIMAAYRIHADGVWSGLPRVDQLEGVIGWYRTVDAATERRYADTIGVGLSRFYDALAAHQLEGGQLRAARASAWLGLRAAGSARRVERRGLLRTLLKSWTLSLTTRRAGGT